MKQVNNSGATLHVPSLGAEVGPGEEIDNDELVPGFTPVEEAPAKKAAKKAPAKKAAAAPAEDADPTPDTDADKGDSETPTTEAADSAAKE